MAASLGGAAGFPWRGAPAGRPGSVWRGAVRPRSRRVARCRPAPQHPAAEPSGDGGRLPTPVPAADGVPPRARTRRRRGVRLTRRGRLVLLVLFLALAAIAVVGVASASRAADPPGPRPTAVVQPGDTLWSVAERHVPSDDPFGAIEEIRRLNDLADYTVHPGQRLVLPDAG